ncbi:MAG: DUF551 domain-containing protein [Phocaeicola vulgatus]
MKQTVEEVAREAAEDCYECHYDDSLEMRLVKEAFIYGAEWQSKQSPWISVKERLPEPNKLVLCRMVSNGAIVSGYIVVSSGRSPYVATDGGFEFEDWNDYECDMWMPIPSFDDILEANRDVLERKRKRRLNMEVNNGIIIDGVLHELCYGTCDKCSLQNECDDSSEIICDIAYENPNMDKCFVSRGKITEIKTEEEQE